MILQILFTWLVFIPIAILNGVVRETKYANKLGDLYAHQVSTFTASTLFLFVAFLVFRNTLSSISFVEAINIGFIWVILTILFEFGFGHFIDHVSWKKLFADYNIFKGRVWVLFLLAELFSLAILKLL